MNHVTLAAILGVMSIVIALEAVWLNRRIKRDRYFGWLSKEPTASVLRTIYFLGFPSLALISGLLPARFLGLKGFESLTPVDLSRSGAEITESILTQFGNVLQVWMPDFGAMAATSTLLGSLFFLYFWFYLTTLKFVDGELVVCIYPSKIDLFFDGVHWGFYRAVAWLVLGNLYLGIVGGLAMILLEYTLASRLGNHSIAAQQQIVFRVMFGLITTVTFLFAPNLWFALAFQYILAVCSEALLKRRQSASFLPRPQTLS